ncbi:MAG: inorganic diphosphatase [Proteobacteria bacterium]|nr:inorganic diphosphatase [Pseudomonadota bacterium]
MEANAIAIGRNPPQDINVVIEVPFGGEPVKYEMDKASGRIFVDRILYTAMRYPGNYGFVPQTLAQDGDPIDVLIVGHQQIVPGAVMNCRPLGVLLMQDEAGPDEKILAVPSDKVSSMYRGVEECRDLPEIQLRQISHFFERYKELEDSKWVKIERWGGADEARALILAAVERFKAS